MIPYYRWSRQHPSVKKTEVILKKSLLFLTRTALIGAIYFVLSFLVQPIAFGPFQFRISEVLVLLPIFFPEAIVGLPVGCLLANFAFSPFGLYDMLFGTLATLLGALGTYIFKKNVLLASLPPVVLNTLLVPIIFLLQGSDGAYYIYALQVLLGEFVVVCLAGIPFTLALKKGLRSAGISFGFAKKFDHAPYRRIVGEEKDEDE